MRILASLVCMKENYLSRRSCGLRIADIAGYKAFHACRRVACFGGAVRCFAPISVAYGNGYAAPTAP